MAPAPVPERMRLLALHARFRAHKAFGMILQISAYMGMVGQVVPQSRMRIQKLLVIHQAGIVGQLLRDLRMLVQVTIIEFGYQTSIRRRAWYARIDAWDTCAALRHCSAGHCADQCYSREAADYSFHCLLL